MIKKLGMGLITIAVVSYFLLFTQLGLNGVVNVAQYFVPGKLTIEYAQGRLYDRFDLHKITWLYQEQVYQFDSITLEYNIYQLITRLGQTNKILLQTKTNKILIERKKNSYHTTLNIQQLSEINRLLSGQIVGQFTLTLGKKAKLSGNAEFFAKSQFMHIEKGVINIADNQAVTLNISQLNFNDWMVKTAKFKGQVIVNKNITLAGQLSFAHLIPSNRELSVQHYSAPISLIIPSFKRFHQYTLNLKGAPLHFPVLGIGTTTGRLQANSNSLQALITQPSGQLQITGNYHFNQHNTWKIQGNHLLAKNNPWVSIVVSPNITINQHGCERITKGTLTINKARFSLENITPNLSPSADVVIKEKVNGTKKQPTCKVTNKTTIELIAAEGIAFSGFNLNGSILGHLTLKQTSHSTLLANGILTAKDASYRLYGKNLNLIQAKLIYSDTPLNNPGLDIRAARDVTLLPIAKTNKETPSFDTPKSGTIVVHMNGRWQNPQIHLTSNLGLSQSDLFAYLLFDMPANKLSLAQAEMLLKAASELTLPRKGQNNSFFDNLKAKLGLDDLDVKPTSLLDANSNLTTQPTLSVGKQLTRKLYLGYSIGLLDPINLLQLKLNINKNLYMKSQVDSQGKASGDLIFQNEYDK